MKNFIRAIAANNVANGGITRVIDAYVLDLMIRAAAEQAQTAITVATMDDEAALAAINAGYAITEDGDGYHVRWAHGDIARDADEKCRRAAWWCYARGDYHRALAFAMDARDDHLRFIAEMAIEEEEEELRLLNFEDELTPEEFAASEEAADPSEDWSLLFS